MLRQGFGSGLELREIKSMYIPKQERGLWKNCVRGVEKNFLRNSGTAGLFEIGDR